MIRTIGVLGAGTMGYGIALSFARHGYAVALYDVDEAVLQRAAGRIGAACGLMARQGLMTDEAAEETVRNITTTANFEQAAAGKDYIIEASPEEIGLKRELFARLDGCSPAGAIWASNTSSLSLSAMLEGMPEARQRRTMICHWFNPGHLVPLVELSHYGNMDEALFCQVVQLYTAIGKRPVTIEKEVPGMLANRMQAALFREVFSLVENGVASVQDIDDAMQYGPAFRLAGTGPVRIADYGGLDIWQAVCNNLLPVMDRRTAANPVLEEKAAAGRLGLKSGEGFYRYGEAGREETDRQFHIRLMRQLRALEEMAQGAGE